MKFTKKSVIEFCRKAKRQESMLVERYIATSLIFEDDPIVYEAVTKLLVANDVYYMILWKRFGANKALFFSQYLQRSL